MPQQERYQMQEKKSSFNYKAEWDALRLAINKTPLVISPTKED